jgi:ADP-heptose:LPS heptosyltransferase
MANHRNGLSDSPNGALPRYGEQLREMTGRYRARNPTLVGVLQLLDILGLFHPRREGLLPSDRPLRVLIANWAHLGDVVAMLPLLNFLANHPRIGRLGVLVGSWSQCIVSEMHIINKVHLLDHFLLDRGKGGRAQKMWRYFMRQRKVVREITDEKYDVSIDLFSVVPSTHRLTWKAGIPMRIGFYSTGLGTYLTHPFGWSMDDEYILNRQLRLLEPLFGREVPKALPSIYPGFTASEYRIGTVRRDYVLMHIGAGDYRSWPIEKWLTLGHALKGRGAEMVFTGAKGPEADLAHAVASQLGACCLAGKLSWNEFVTVVAKARAVISVDTVTGHLAACFSVPSVILLSGRWGKRFFRPNNVNATTITYPVGCSPCYRSIGCDSMACVRYISVDDVLSALDNLMRH